MDKKIEKITEKVDCSFFEATASPGGDILMTSCQIHIGNMCDPEKCTLKRIERGVTQILGMLVKKVR